MIAVLTAIIFFAGRLILSFYTENNWSYNHWQFISTGYLITWSIIALITGYLLFRKNEWFYNLFKNKIITAASLVAITIILTTIGLPLEALGLILAVDRVLDMCRTTVNVFSDSCGAVVIARTEGEQDILTGQPAKSSI